MYQYPVVRDDPELIEEALRTAVSSNDLVIISAGSSAGTRDFTAQVIESIGELIFHGVALKPGKPAMLGKIDGKPVLGLPGYPLAAQTVIREFAVPLLEAWGLPGPAPHTVTVKLAHTLSSDIGFDEFIPVSLGRIGDTCWAVPHSRGSAIQTATVKANGFIHIPAPFEGFEAGSELMGILTTDPGNIDRTLILTGVYDPAIPALTHLMRNQGIFLHASTAGNIGAMLALKRNSCHAALLSVPEFSLLPGSVNLTHLFPISGLTFVHIASVAQGIASREEFTFNHMEKVRFINQHKGSPGRILFDSLLKAGGINSAKVNGYLHEVGSNHAVANAILNGFADAGICTSCIANEYGLCFQPLTIEQYELATRNELVAHSMINNLISEINSLEFRQQLLENGGYDLSQTGAVRCMSDDHLNPDAFISHVSSA